MADIQVAPGTSEAALIELKSYNLTLPMGTLAIGVDNIHHDVFLSPRFSQAARDYLFNLIRQSASANFFSGIELRDTQIVDAAAFRKILTEVMRSSLTQAKFRKNIEIDLLFRLALLKFLSLRKTEDRASIGPAAGGPRLGYFGLNPGRGSSGTD